MDIFNKKRVKSLKWDVVTLRLEVSTLQGNLESSKRKFEKKLEDIEYFLKAKITEEWKYIMAIVRYFDLEFQDTAVVDEYSPPPRPKMKMVLVAKKKKQEKGG